MGEIAAEIFREYDVRGVFGTDLSANVARLLGRAVGTTVRRGAARDQPVVVVGRDCRASGVELSGALSEGIASCGVKVLDIGVVPTPVQYWAIERFGADGGVCVTGSHNPPEYNGFKLTLLGRSLYGEHIQALRRLIDAGDFATASAPAAIEQREVIADYLDDLGGSLQKPSRKLKIVVDCGNGTAGLTTVPLYEALGCDVVPLFCEPDSTFPNHHPDPSQEENLVDLRKAVASEGADIGLAFDGDGDRVGVIDRNGDIIWGDKLMILLSRALLQESPGATIIGEVKCSKTFFDDVAANGGKPLMWKAGHSLIKAKMKETGALLAGEMSGHIFYKHRYYGFDDATYAGGRLLEVLGSETKPLDELLADVPETFSTPELRVDCPESIKFELVDRVTESLKKKADIVGDFRVIDTDGARAEWNDGWGLVRCSNTQPLLVLRFEAQNEARLAEIRAYVEHEVGEQRRTLDG